MPCRRGAEQRCDGGTAAGVRRGPPGASSPGASPAEDDPAEGGARSARAIPRRDGNRAQRLEGRARAGRLRARRGPGTPGGPTGSGRRAGAPSGGAGTAGRAGTHVTAAPPVSASASGGAGRPGQPRGRTWRASGLPRNLSSCCGSRLRTCSTFAMFLSGGAPLPGRPPERSPEAGGVTAAPPLNLERGGRPGRGRGSPTGCARGGGAAYAVQAQGRRARARPRCPASARHARTQRRTHARTQRAGRLGCARSGGEKLRARSPSRCCAQARRGPRGGATGWQGAGCRGSLEAGPSGMLRREDSHREGYLLRARGGQPWCKVLYSIIVKRRNFHFTLAYVVPGTGRD